MGSFLHWRWKRVYFSQTKNFHWNKNFIEKCLPDSRQTLLSDEKASCWGGNTDYRSVGSVSMLRPPHTALKWNLLASRSTNLLPLGVFSTEQGSWSSSSMWNGPWGSAGADILWLSSAKSFHSMYVSTHLLHDQTPTFLWGFEMGTPDPTLGSVRDKKPAE